MSTESDTPRVNQNACYPASNDDSDKYSEDGTHVDVDFARQLERELNELIKQRDALLAMLDKITEIAERVDGWESFPSKPIDQAHELMQSINLTTETK